MRNQACSFKVILALGVSALAGMRDLLLPPVFLPLFPESSHSHARLVHGRQDRCATGCPTPIRLVAMGATGPDCQPEVML